MPRVVKSREEFEGEIYESLVLVEGKDLPVPPAGTEFVEIAHSRRRIDGAQRVTGRARYTQDIYPAGMLHVRVLRSPLPRARVRRIDTKRAEALPGVRGVLHRFNAPKAAFRGDDVIFREEVRFVGEEVCAVAADDEDTAREALGLVDVDYERFPHVVDLEEAIGDVAPRLESDGNVSEGGSRTPSTIASYFAMRLGKPIRCVLTRDEENLAAGNRSATLQQLRLGAKAGRITAIEHTSWANVGQGKWVANPTGPTNTLYEIANLSSKSYKVVTNAGSLAAFRAPGYVEGTFALESAIDELADKMGVDPLVLRRKHAASPKDPMVGKRYSDKHLIQCYRIGAAA